jgi:uncharacterized membrane protein YfcA
MIALPSFTLFGLNVYLLILLGFFVGVLGGFFGVGGTWIVTPGLNLLGLPIAFAVGTDLLHTMGKGIVATLKHRKFGHIDMRLGLFMVVGSTLGIKIGETLLLHLEALGTADAIIRIIYVFVLLGIAAYVLADYYRLTVRHRSGRRSGRLRLFERMQRLRVPPYISLPASGIERISWWVPLGVAVVTGFMSGLLGVGAGFIRMPSLIYVIGVPTKMAIGTDLFEVIFSAGFGAFFYAIDGRVVIAVAAIMLLGAAVGAQIGTVATQYVKGMRIRLYFGFSVLFPALALAIKQWGALAGIPRPGLLSEILLFGSAFVVSLVILRALVRGILEARADRLAEARAARALASLTSDAGPVGSRGAQRRPPKVGSP